MLINCLAVGLGGVLGAMSRYLLGLVILPWGAFPLGTFIINICGACLLGAINAWTAREGLGQSALAFFLKAGAISCLVPQLIQNLAVFLMIA